MWIRLSHRVCATLTLLLFATQGLQAADERAARSANTRDADVYDVVIYGGTSAAVTAAVQAQEMGKTAIVVSPDKHLGGLSSGGLGWTDSGNKAVIGGLARQFYHRIWREYQQPETWKWQAAEEYGNKGQGTPAIDKAERTMWIFEPHVAEQVFDAWVEELRIPVVRNAWLDRKQGVELQDNRIASITTLDGETYRGRMFIDATYEGDLMAAAGVSYHVGRESSSQYGETWNGVQVGVLHHRHHFGAVPKPISPYVVPDDPSSGLLPRISGEDPGQRGEADKRIQAYCFRMCLTNAPENRIPFPKPEGYDPGQYELLVRIFDAGWRETFDKFDPIPNHKTDTNNHGPFSTDNIGYNYDYPEGSYDQRRAIIREHETYQKGLMYFLANDPRVPEEVRTRMQQWGLPRDEFTDNGHWPHQIYVREARRMVGKYVMTENELLKKRPTPESVGMGSYTMDSHNVQRYVTPEGYVQNEGDIGVSTRGPYEIAYGSLVPKREECENLLVPVCVSSSHIAFGSIRMEPVFMILGQSAATAAALAIDGELSVQEVPYDRLRERLVADGQVLEWTDPRPTKQGVAPKSLGGVVVDDEQAKLVGNWGHSTTLGKWVASGYLHDGSTTKGEASATFSAELPSAGRYEVRLAYSAGGNRSSNVPVRIQHAAGTATVSVDQKKTPPIDGLLISLGSYDFSELTAEVTVSNAGTEGHVIVDAVQWLPLDQ
ncbi:FAD-dependent oxidoreductase [Candidatus Laterigemmans baculatus]|uniref:FAD-dependent oxidoreductase n=1 Tax=Candidatus Laterigemmans baculatus TaxID=2770505 RepID=UPI0013DC3042|nr:FAD-dependent oxidoreductase [Candidatus Laterigemmans baculatus]